MPAAPLSHHDIVALVEPFTRRGWRVDLAASRRDDGRLVFRPAAEAAATAAPAAAAQLQVAIDLEVLGPRRFRLVRAAGRGDGLEATLRAQGGDLAALLDAVEAVPLARHFDDAPGVAIVRHYTLDGARAAPVLARGVAHIAGHGAGHVAEHVAGHAAGPVPEAPPAALVLTLTVPPVRRVAADLSLVVPPGTAIASPPALPQDALAVLGWNWTRLVPHRLGWTSKLRLRAVEPERTRRAEAALDRAARHLAQTLAEPPARFHERHLAARWGVFGRRGIPTFTALALVGLVLLSSRFELDLPTHVWVLLYHVPTLIVAAAFLTQELPRFEIPPWPRVPKASRW